MVVIVNLKERYVAGEVADEGYNRYEIKTLDLN